MLQESWLNFTSGARKVVFISKILLLFAVLLTFSLPELVPTCALNRFGDFRVKQAARLKSINTSSENHQKMSFKRQKIHNKSSTIVARSAWGDMWGASRFQDGVCELPVSSK